MEFIKWQRMNNDLKFSPFFLSFQLSCLSHAEHGGLLSFLLGLQLVVSALQATWYSYYFIHAFSMKEERSRQWLLAVGLVCY